MRKLTAAGLARLQPDATKRLEIPDAIAPGLYHVVQSSGARSWCLRYRFAGRTRKLTLSRIGATDLEEARRQARAALQAVAEGRDPAAEKKRARAAAITLDGTADTFGAAARLFIERYARPNNRSWK